MATHTYTIVLAVPDVYVTADFTAETTLLGAAALRLTQNQNPTPHIDDADSDDLWDVPSCALTTNTGIVT